MEKNRLFYWISILLIVILSFIIKLNLLNKYEAPPSPDYGNYLTQLDVIHGYDLRGLGLRYNPLFFILLDLFVRIFDEFTALKIAASFVFSIVAVPFYLLAKRISKNDLAALICTWFIVFFEGYAEMIAWGGNPNFLGFSFMFLTIFFLINVIEKPSKRNIFFMSLFLSFIIGTHLLVTVFIMISFLFFILLTFIFNRNCVNNIIKYFIYAGIITVIFSLPYIPFYETFIKNSSKELVGLIYYQKIYDIISDLAWMFQTQHIIIVIMTILGSVTLIRYIKKNKSVSLIIFSLFLTPLLLILTTNQPDRWLYFLPIPIILSFNLFLDNLFAVIRNAKKDIVILTLCLIILFGMGTAISSINRLETAISNYQSLHGDELQALRWIKENTPANSTFATSGPNKMIGGNGNAYSWWIEGYSKRKSISAGNPDFFSYQYEREEVEIANKIFAGAYTVDHGNIEVTESFPAGLSNPEIGGLADGVYQGILFLDDGSQQLIFSSLENEQILNREAPLQSQNKTIDIEYNGARINTTFDYHWSGIKLSRRVAIRSDQSAVDVIFEITPINSTLKQFKICLWPSASTVLEGYAMNNSTLTLRQKVSYNEIIETNITIFKTNGDLQTEVHGQDENSSTPMVTFSLKPLQKSLLFHIKISANFRSLEASDQAIHFYNSYDLIRSLGIQYIFQNKGRVSEYQRFLYDPAHYSLVFENENIAIFRVM